MGACPGIMPPVIPRPRILRSRIPRLVVSLTLISFPARRDLSATYAAASAIAILRLALKANSRSLGLPAPARASTARAGDPVRPWG